MPWYCWSCHTGWKLTPKKLFRASPLELPEDAIFRKWNKSAVHLLKLGITLRNEESFKLNQTLKVKVSSAMPFYELTFAISCAKAYMNQVQEKKFLCDEITSVTRREEQIMSTVRVKWKQNWNKLETTTHQTNSCVAFKPSLWLVSDKMLAWLFHFFMQCCIPLMWCVGKLQE